MSPTEESILDRFSKRTAQNEPKPGSVPTKTKRFMLGALIDMFEGGRLSKEVLLADIIALFNIGDTELEEITK